MTWVLLATLAAGAFQLWLGERFRPRKRVGDEGSYLRRGTSADPLVGKNFVRVPLFPWLSWLAHRVAGRKNHELTLRGVVASISVFNFFLGSVLAHSLAGLSGLALFATACLVFIERAWLGWHIWPDTLAGTVVVASIAGIHWGWSPWYLGLLISSAFLLRLDLLVLWPAILLTAATSVADAMAMTIPLFVVALALSIYNRARYETWLPDNTWQFNVRLMQVESQAVNEPFRVGKNVSRVRHNEMKQHGIGSYGRMIVGVVSRWMAMFGPDTFIRQQLLEKKPGGYPELSSVPRWLNVMLVWSGPLTLMLAIGIIILGGVWPRWGWLLIAVAIGLTVVHFRTRYRIAVVPAIFLLATANLHPALSRLQADPEIGILVGVIALVLTVLLARYPVREEV